MRREREGRTRVKGEEERGVDEGRGGKERRRKGENERKDGRWREGR